MQDIPPNIEKMIAECARTMHARHKFADYDDLRQEGRVAYVEYVSANADELQSLPVYQREGRIFRTIFRKMGESNEVTCGNPRSHLAANSRRVKDAVGTLEAAGQVEPTLPEIADALNRPQYTVALVEDVLRWARARLSGDEPYSPNQPKYGSLFKSIEAARTRLLLAGVEEPTVGDLVEELNKPRWTVKRVKNALGWTGAVHPIPTENLDVFALPDRAEDEAPALHADPGLDQLYCRLLAVLDRMAADLSMSEVQARRQALLRAAIEHVHVQVGLGRAKLEPIENVRLGQRFGVSADLAKKDKERAVDLVEKYLSEQLQDAKAVAALRTVVELMLLHQRAEPLSQTQRERIEHSNRERSAAPELKAFLDLCLGHLSNEG